MAQSSKKQNFLQGAALLALANAIVKVIGAIYKIPLKAIIGDIGYSYFNTAYIIYSLLLTIATAGLPIAMSRMISQASSLGQYNRVRRIYRVSKVIFLSLGLVCTLIMAIFCRTLADFYNQRDAWFAILCLSPCALLMGFLSTYRGFFQGQGNMVPTSTSQVLEAICKLVVGFGFAFTFMQLWGNVSISAGGAIIGVSASCLVSAIFLAAKFRPAYQSLPVTNEEVESFQKTAKNLMSIAVPIMIGSAGLQLLNALEMGIYMDQVENLLSTHQYVDPAVSIIDGEVQLLKDYDPANHYSLMASGLKGIYDFSTTIFNLPSSFIVPINTSVLPAITACLTLDDHNGVRSTEESAARITGLLAAPCAIGLAVLAEPVMGLLGDYAGDKLILAGKLMAVMGCSVFFYSSLMYTNVLLQSHGKAQIPVIHTLLCGVVRLVAVYVLSGNPHLGILGVPISALLCYVSIFALNLLAIHFRIPQKPRLLQNLLRPVLPAALMGAAVFGVVYLMKNVANITSNLLLCAVPVFVGVVVYVVGVILFKTITREDCLLLPKGEKLANLLKL